MSKEVEDIYCSNCNKKCDQSLMLSCDHNLCMNCAAENLIKNESKGINKIQYIICDLCQKKTEIDTNTSKEVLALGLTELNKNKEQIEDNFNEKNFDIDRDEKYNTFHEEQQRFNTYDNNMNIKNNDINNLTSPVNIVFYIRNIIFCRKIF